MNKFKYTYRYPTSRGYRPFENYREVFLKYPLKDREIGMTFLISEDDTVTEYWFKDGIENEDLVVKGSGGGEGGAVAWSDITDKPLVIAAGANQAAARTAIGAGTSNLALGTTSTTALKGDTVIPVMPTWTTLSGKPTTFAPSTHTHTIAQVTDLQTTLDSKPTMVGGLIPLENLPTIHFDVNDFDGDGTEENPFKLKV